MSELSSDAEGGVADRNAEFPITGTLGDRFDAALRETVHRRVRAQMLSALSESDRFDLDAADTAWGGVEDTAHR